jgi:hypothetical protein
VVDVLVEVLVDVETVVVVVPVEPGHWPFTGRTSPWRMCAGTAFREMVISLYGRFFEPVRWQTWTFLPLGRVVVVVVVEPLVEVELESEVVEEAGSLFFPLPFAEPLPLPFPLPLPGGLPLDGAGPATATETMRPATKSASRETFSFIRGDSFGIAAYTVPVGRWAAIPASEPLNE